MGWKARSLPSRPGSTPDRYGAPVALTNWAETYTYQARALHEPATLEQLQEIVSAAARIRVLGSRHTFSEIGDSAELVSLDRLPAEIAVDRGCSTVTVGGATRYGELAELLVAEELALANLASLPHIAVAGAVATGTHGSGDNNGNLATSVAGLELVTSSGELVRVARGDADFDGIVVGLGAAGVVTHVTLDVEPGFEVRQWVFERLGWEALFQHFDEVMSAGYSVSVFTEWGESCDQVWVKNRVGSPLDIDRDELFGAVAARVDLHPIAALDPINCTPQMGVPGPWSERLPHFRMGFTPSVGAEIQSEFIVARGDAVNAIGAVLGIADTVRPVLQLSEIRSIAADSLWMSPEYGRESVAIHFTWKREPAAVREALARVEAALAPYAARPHWGKLFLAGADTIGPLYPRLEDFAALLSRVDPRGAFGNAWLQTRVLSAG